MLAKRSTVLLSDRKMGLFGVVIGRAEAQVVRLAALYAAMDCCTALEVEHLAAAAGKAGLG